MPEETFGINNKNTQPTNTPSTPMETLVTTTPTTQAPTPTEPTKKSNPEPPALDLDKKLEKQLEEIPNTEKPKKKLPIKILAIVFVLLLGGGAIAYFFLGMSSNSTEKVVVNDPPPSFSNPFASNKKDDEVEKDVQTADPNNIELATPDTPPSLNLPSSAPPKDTTTPTVSKEFVETVENLKETSDAAANLTETPLLEEVPKKISR